MTRIHITRLVAGALSVALVAAGFWYGRNVPFASQWPLYEALRTTAAIIFAVVGAWLAIIYPERLRFSGRGGLERGAIPEKGEGIGRFFTPIAHSTAILCLVLLIGVVAPLLKQLPVVLEHVVIARSVAYGVLVSLTLWQLWTVVLTLVPADEIKRASDFEDSRRHLMAPLTRLGSVAKPEKSDT